MTAETNGPAVSVVITAYNAERWIGETLDSVLAQTWRDYEVVVVDDGSTDCTAEIVKGFGSPIRYLHQENRGQPAARNAGIRAALGRFIAFLDADDLWHPKKLEQQMVCLMEDPLQAWCYTDAFLFNSKTRRIWRTAGQHRTLPAGWVFQPLLLGNFILSVTPVVRRDVFEEVGYFNEDPTVQNGEDWEMWLRIAEQYPVGVVRKPLALVREHTARMSQSVDLDYALRSRLKILRAALARHPEVGADVRRRAEANVYGALGRWAVDRQQRLAAVQLLVHALSRAPADVRHWTYLVAALLPRSVMRALGRVREQVWARQRDPHAPETVAQVLVEQKRND